MVREYINMEDVVAMSSCRPTSDRKEAGTEFVARSNVFRRFLDFDSKGLQASRQIWAARQAYNIGPTVI